MKSSAQISAVNRLFRWGSLFLLAFTLCSEVHATWNVQPATEWSEELRVWDPAPELNLAFSWTGPRNGNKEAEGEGRLVWHHGFIQDVDSIVSIYTGFIKGGKREGRGVWYHRSGSKYAGEWKNNLKDGLGEYWLKNGDYYQGPFRQDKLHGSGRYVFTDGSVYEGPFVEGFKEGAGTLTLPDGRIHKSSWTKDVDVNPPTPPSAPYVVLGIDNSKYAFDAGVLFSGEGGGAHEDHLTYRGHWEGEFFSIVPDWLYWTLWKNGGPIGGLGNFGLGVYPVFLELRIYNPSREKLTISSAEIEVRKSSPDAEPILEIGASDASRIVEIVNLYPRAVNSIELSYNLVPNNGLPGTLNYKFKESIGTFNHRTTFSIDNSLNKLGVDVQLIKQWEAEKNNIFTDQQNDAADYEIILARKEALLAKIRTGLDSVKQFAEQDEHNVRLELRLVGEMKVLWTDHDGSRQTTSVKVDFPKVFFVADDEGGAGGPASGQYDILLETVGDNYVRPFSYKRTLAPGENDRFVVTLASNESSYQEFRVRLVTTDGREIDSPPCLLHFLVPGGHDWQRGFRVLP